MPEKYTAPARSPRKNACFSGPGEPLEGSRNYAGTLLRADEEGIDLEREGRTFRFAYGAVHKAKLEVTQEDLFGKGKRKQ